MEKDGGCFRRRAVYGSFECLHIGGDGKMRARAASLHNTMHAESSLQRECRATHWPINQQ